MYTIEQRDSQLVDSTASIRYRLTFQRSASHLLDVLMEVDDPGDDVVLMLPRWIPGSYKIRDFVSFQGDIRPGDGDDRPLDFEWIAGNRLRVATRGVPILRLRYTYFGNERSVRMTHIARHHAFINPANCMMMVEGRTDRIHHVEIVSNWSRVSTALSPVREGVWGALNYDILIDSPIEIGDHFVESYERHGAMHEVAITGIGDFVPHWIVERTKTIVDQGVAMWGDLPYDRYVFIIQLLPGEYGGLEHARSSVNMFESGCFNEPERIIPLLTLLCHEYFHLWNVKRIRPIELGPFDYDRENNTRMLWLAEGVTSYYDDLMTYRCGFIDRAGLLKRLSQEHLAKLLDVPGRQVMSLADSSYLAWVKLYVPTPDSHNRFPSYYLKGGVVFLLLDMHIIAETNGERSLDDGMRALWDRYRRDPSTGITDEEFLDLVEAGTGVSIRQVLIPWLSTTTELPVAEVVSRLGLAWHCAQEMSSPTFGDGIECHPGGVPHRWVGCATEESKGGIRVARVWRDSPAEEAGLGVSDEIIAVDGCRVASSREFDAALRRARDRSEVSLLCSGEGAIYQTTLRFSLRETYELVESADANDSEKNRLGRWLQRLDVVYG